MVERIRKKRGWDLSGSGPNEDKHRGFFVVKRTEILVDLHPQWKDTSEPNQAALQARLEAEIDLVEAYLTQKLAADRLGGEAEAGASPPAAKTDLYIGDVDKHINLADVAYPATTTRDRDARRRRVGLVAFRRRQVRAIVWRAAAIHVEFWSNPNNPGPATFNAALMDRTLDRRLRPVERMSTQVATHAHLCGFYEQRSSTFTPAKAPVKLRMGQQGRDWFDDFRVRPFEYPRLPLNQRSQSGIYAPDAVAKMGPGGIQEPEVDRFTDGGAPWRYSENRSRLEYNVPPRPGVQLRAGLSSRFSQRNKPEDVALIDRLLEDTTYDVNLKPSAGAPGETVGLLVQAQRDWWDRTWLFCDHVLSALNTEALRFSLRRTTADDSQFNTLAARTQNPPGFPAAQEYMQLTHHLDMHARSVPGGKVRDVMMAGEAVFHPDTTNDEDQFFENRPILTDEIQVGDELAMFNSFVYGYISDDEWRFEYSFVLDVVSDHRARTAGLALDKLMLIGHGIEARLYPDYQSRIAARLDEALASVRSQALRSTADHFRYGGNDVLVVKWDPYNEFPGQTAWWLVLSLNVRGSVWPSPPNAKAAIARSVLVADAPNPVNPFPDSLIDHPSAGDDHGFVLFPLFEPAIPGSKDPWNDYLARRTTPGFRVPRLKPVPGDGTSMPGIYLRGMSGSIQVIRPKVSV
jgi:hypothetical protein